MERLITTEDLLSGKIVKKVIRSLRQAAEEGRPCAGLPTGFTDLDHLTDGLTPSDLIVLAGRPAMGCTSLALSILKHAVVDCGKPAAFFSLTESKETEVKKLLSIMSGAEYSGLRRGSLSEEGWEKVQDAADHLQKADLIIDDACAIGIDELCTRSRIYKEELDIQLIVIDSLQFITSLGRTTFENQSFAAEILKKLAEELEIPVLLVAKVARAADQRMDHRPEINDIECANAVERYADEILFLYRDSYYHPERDDKAAEVIIARNRKGTIGRAELVYEPDCLRFSSRQG